MSIVEQYLLQLNTRKRRWRRAVSILTALSLIVAFATVWNLRMTGITIANSASCEVEEHQHTEQCLQADCNKSEHIHNTGCYSNPAADVESSLDWRAMFKDYPYTGDLRQDLAGIAKTQVGYRESTLNFEVRDGQRCGYSRYGAWYGAPYNEWSAIFVSFCLEFAGADPAVFLPSSGAATMAQLWKTQDKFAAAGEYTPVSGDLVFFDDNTMGIVTEVLSGTFCLIRGDLDNAVGTEALSLEDSRIIGWGITEGRTDKAPAEQEPLSEMDLLDISNGPAFFIFEGEGSMPRSRGYSLRATRTTIVDLLPYLEANGGSYFFTLLDKNNMELPKDDQGNYIATANNGYKLTITFNSPLGFAPGTYQYQIPNGLMVDGGEGEFILKDGTKVGSWVVTDTGLITLDFNQNMNSHSEITISATLGINFPEQNDPIDFDGFISVKVEPPAPQLAPTVVSKWGTPNATEGKLNWNVWIQGHADSQIPGSILTDQVTLPDWGKPHYYSESDIAAGIQIGATAADGSWHSWRVTIDDPHLIWDENGWSYKFPQTVECMYCGEVELGSNGWEYMVTYTSTPAPLNTPGAFAYENKVTIDGQSAWGWNEFVHGSIEAEISKDGRFVSDAAGGGFLWEFQTVIPGRPEGQRAVYSWFIMDEMKLVDKGGIALRKIYNDANKATVTANYNGTLIQVPRIQDATDQDMFAWDAAWASEGVASTRTLNLLCRCQCTPETCRWGGCEDYWFQRDDGSWATNGFCQCWTETQNMTFTFVYKTEDLSSIEAYGTLGYQLNNQAQLYYMPDGATSVQMDYDDATVPIPNVFEKQLTHDFNGYTAHYKITVNEAKLVLTDGSPLTIRDEMTDTLAYISGSLMITTENAAGHTSALQLGTDFTVTYDGTGNQKDNTGKKIHVLEIVILNPQPVMYILDYDTTLIMPEQITGGIKYTNSATITLWGDKVKDTAAEKVYADINIATKSFTVELFKSCSLTGKPLPGATFGLYNAQGGQIATGVTDANGELAFQTNIVEGIVLREHTLYYLQELEAPPAYQLDSTKNWFCFCNNAEDNCATCNALLDGLKSFRVPLEKIGIVDLSNHHADVILPATGGVGYAPYILCGLTLVVGPLVYGFSLRRRYGRRSKQ